MYRETAKLLIFGVLSAISFWPLYAHALSIGELKVKSSYAQPLDAEISVPSYKNRELDTLSVSLASQAEYQQRELEWQPLLQDIQFTVRVTPQNTPYIHVRSHKPVHELVLNLLVEFSWDGGQSFKQFDILLSPALPKSTTEDKNTTTVNQRQDNPPTAFETEVAMVEQDSQGEVDELPFAPAYQSKLEKLSEGEFSYGPVMPGESLSQIAERLADKSDLNLADRMNVLFKLNPEAFANHRYSSLKAGYKLRFSNQVQPDNTPPSNINDEPIYETNVDSTQSLGRVVRLQEIKGSEQELTHLVDRLQKVRNTVEQYRKENSTLRVKILELENQARAQAEELGIVIPEQD